MTNSNEKKNYFAEVKKKAAKSDNSSFAFILLLIGIIIVGTQVSGLHQELNLLKKELNYDNQIDSFNAKIESVDKMYLETVKKLEKQLELLEKKNKELTKQLSFISSNVGDLQNDLNQKNKLTEQKVVSKKEANNDLLSSLLKEQEIKNTSKKEDNKSKIKQPVNKWEQLRKGMNERQVILVLGQPSFVDKDFITKWYYPNGRVNFDNDMKLSWWTNK